MKTAKEWCDEKCHNMRGGFEFSRGDIERVQQNARESALREAAEYLIDNFRGMSRREAANAVLSLITNPKP